jgi:acyl carrier protein
MTDVRDRLLAIIGKIKKKSPGEIDLSAEVSQLNIDSLDVVEMLMNIEEEFQMYLPVSEELSKIKTVGDLIDTLERMIEEAKEDTDG